MGHIHGPAVQATFARRSAGGLTPALIGVLAFGGICIALLARLAFGYPNCHTDETNWAAIMSRLDHGASEPVSGPLFVWFHRLLAQTFGGSYETALAVTGTMAVPLVLVAGAWAYSRWTIPLVRIGLALACTSYFWAPLIESRPQQVGEALVLAGNVLLWQVMKGRVPWPAYAGVLLVTLLTHLLSFAILVASGLVAWIAAALLLGANMRVLGLTAVSIALGSALVVVPGGPYASLLVDIRANHIRAAAGPMVIAAVGASLALLAVWIARGRLAGWSRLASSSLLRIAEGSLVLATCLVAAVAALALGFQAAMLPAEAWKPYGASATLFAASAAGNVLFAWLVIRGISLARLRFVEGQREEWMIAFGIFSLAFVVLGCAALLVSPWLLHKNWMLRNLNYAILFVAPFAALGLEEFQARFRASWISVVGALVAISFVSAVRYPAVFNC